MRADGEEMLAEPGRGDRDNQGRPNRNLDGGAAFVELRDYAFGAVGEPTDGKSPFRAAIDKKIA